MIDRERVIRRHNPTACAIDPLSPFTVGNGEFAFSADVTGLQSFPEYYAAEGIPLGTMSNWGWQTHAPGDLDIASYRWVPVNCGGTVRPFAYTARMRFFGHPPAYEPIDDKYEDLVPYFRQNPHRWHLGILGFCANGRPLAPGDVDSISQELDLWTGVLQSRFEVLGRTVTVRTACHPERDVIAAEIDSDAFGAGLQLVLRFGASTHEMAAVDWSRPETHSSELERLNSGLVIRRREDDAYVVRAEWEGRANVECLAPHQFVITPQTNGRFAIAVGFFPEDPGSGLPDAEATFAASARAWNGFWQSGAAVDFEGSTDSRAVELERRVVLSQYLTRTQSCGSLPPQETGLTCNSWGGKFHLEMHWWHAVHFPLWGRPALLERSLAWYRKILPVARDGARRQGYEGARWPKQVGPEGRESPSAIGCFLIWQQPHPIYYAELMYRTDPSPGTLERYAEIVDETAAFLGSFPVWSGDRCNLEPMLIPMQENHSPFETRNPSFELAYWRFGLSVAQTWRERRGITRNPDWDRVLAGLPELPQANGLYLAHERCPDTYTKYNFDHPLMLGMYGMIPGAVDVEAMRKTLDHAEKTWRWDAAWGWDFPMAAMCATRLGEVDKALDLLLMECPKNRYLNNGHNWQRPSLPMYLPGNGALLTAIAMMLGGFDDRGPAAFAPAWRVRSEGFRRAL